MNVLNFYPDGYILPDIGSYEGLIDVGLRRSSMPTALPTQEKVFNSPRELLTLTFSMSNDDYISWFAWARAYGWQWFRIDIISSHKPVLITSNHIIRFVSEINYVKRTDNWVSLEVSAELLPSDAEDPNVPVPIYDWVIAGTPASPSINNLIAKTAVDPAIDYYISHLYYW